MKVELDLSNYVTKADLKRGTSIDTTMLATKADLAGLKTNIDDFNVDRLLMLIMLSKKLCMIN